MAENLWRGFKSDVLKILEEGFEKLGWPKKDLEESLEEPQDSSFGHMASTVCFELPKDLHRSPEDISQELSENLKPGGLVEKVEAVGGYINFFVEMSVLSNLALDNIEERGSEYGHLDHDEKKVVIEHTSVNPTKPLHIGHGRNAVIGDTMARILKACGKNVEVQNYIDDLGLQVAQTLIAYKADEEVSGEKFDHYLGKLYVDFHEKAKSNSELKQKARNVLSSMEKGRGELAQEAREMSLLCVESNLETTDRLDIDYDLLVWESDISRTGMLEESLGLLRKTPYLVEGEGKHEGAMVLHLSDFGLEDKVLVRSDGTAVYTARDIAYQLWKFGKVEANLCFDIHSERPSGVKTYTTVPESDSNIDFGSADQVINVIGMEQRYPQNVVFSALKVMGFEKEYRNSHHLAYEHVRLESEKFEGRKGTWMGYSVDDVLDETVERAREEVKKRNPDSNEDFIRKAAESVGVGAFRYSLISSSPEKEVVFKWEEVLDFDRNSGPAIQYSHARANNILRKAEGVKGKLEDYVFEEEIEDELITKLVKFPEVVREAGENLQPHKVATYASELALLFNKFYEVAPVLHAEEEDLMYSRLKLVKCVKIVLENSLRLLGIEAPGRM